MTPRRLGLIAALAASLLVSPVQAEDGGVESLRATG